MATPSVTKNPVIEAKSLVAGYGKTVIWKDANFSVRESEFIGVLGPNGAGKTTLLRLILGTLAPKSGQLKVFGHKPTRGNKHIGYMPQRHLVDMQLNIEAIEFVRLGLSGTRLGFATPSLANKELELSLEALDLVNAKRLANRQLSQLSGGELQRVFLAQALIGKPKLLLLDEPLANLDIRRENELVRLIAEVAKTQKVAVLLIAHNINPLLPATDRLIYTVNGQIEIGTPKDIITSKKLSDLYRAPIEVIHDSRGRLVVVGTEEVAHHV
jgi:zinc/manganese transport system ATP-binding protein